MFADGYGIQKANTMRREKEAMKKEWKKGNAEEAGRAGERDKAKATAHLEFGPEGQRTRGFNQENPARPGRVDSRDSF